MNPRKSPPPGDADEEVSALIATLHETGQRLEELTGGEVDTVADREGRTFLLGRAQEQVRHIEAKKQAAILNALPAHIALLDTQGLIISVNEAWRGFAATDVVQRPGYEIGLNYLEICDEARGEGSSEAHQAAAGIRSVVSGRTKSFSIEYPSHSPTEQRWFLMTVTPLAGDRPNGAVVMHLDITEQKQDKDELRESERRSREMLGNMQLVSVMLDREARITYCNEYLLRLTGWRHEEVIGQNWFELFMPPELGDMKPVFAALLTNAPEAWHRENEMFTRSGERRLVRWNNSVLRSGAGEVIGVASIGEDITERKEAEARIAYLNRVYAMLSGITTLIVRERDRDKLLREACRIAVEEGGFRMSLLCTVDRDAGKIVPVASAGKDEELLTAIKGALSSSEGARNTMVARAIREKKALVSNNSQSDPRVVFGKKYAESGVRSMAILPLIVSDEAVGTLALYASESEFFHEEEMKLLTELAGDISFALEHIGKEEKIARLNRIQAVMSGINSAIVRVRDRAELFKEACRIAVEEGGLLLAWIGMVDRSLAKIVPIASAGANEELLAAIKDRLSSSEGGQLRNSMSARAIREKKAGVSNDAQSDPALVLSKTHVGAGIRSMAMLPLIVSDEAIGVLGLYSEEIGFFDDEEMKLLTGLTGDISFALENISRQQNLAKLARIRAVSGEINATIVRIHDRDALLRETCRIAVEHGKFELVWIALLDQEKQRIQPVAWAGFSSEVAHDLTWASLSRPGVTLAEVIRTRKVAVRNDVDTEMPAGSLRQVAIKKGYRSTVCVPLVVDDSVVAAIILFAPGQGFFDEEELRLLTGLAGNISFALENISGQQRLGKLSRIRAVSSGINAAIIRIRERKALLEEACRIVSERGKFEMIWIGAIDHDGEQVEPLAWKGFSEEAARAVSWASIGNAKGTLGEAMQTRKASVRNDIEGELPGGKLRHEALKLGCQSSVCLPLVVDDRVTALVVLFAPGRGFFDKDELALLDEVASDISFALQAIEKQKKLEYLSYYDVLTGLANRTLFLERLARYMHSAVSGGHKLAVGLIDLERFKNINDSLGRPAGDALLKQVAEWLTRNLGDTSRLARVGADHFAVVLPEVKADGNMAGLIDGFMTSFLEHPFRLKDAVFRLAFKLGVALFPDDGADADTLLQNAEAALKKAKASGDRYLFYMQKMTNTVAGNLTLENQLRQALDNEEFVLHYQPKVSLESGKLTGAEALIRWNDPRTGLVPPGQFIPILEETGLIFEVGRWALRKSIEDYLRWRAAGLPAVRIAVNVSPLQLRNRGFVAEIEQVIGVDAHAPAGLELEITESLIMQDIKHNIASLKAIQGMGITIAIDDFGTGFSSLAYLSKLPVDTLKIDRSFVIDMTAGAEGLALVSTIINLAHSLKLKVVAEGVETEEQSRLLRLLNCDEMQGFLFSKPVPVEIFETRFLALPSVGG